MTDRLDPDQRRRLMQRVKGKDTLPERTVRSLLHKLGYRFRLHRKDLPGTPDIVLPSRRVALFVEQPSESGSRVALAARHDCRIGKLPKSRLDYWGPKIDANRARDLRKENALAAGGWRVAVVWQCELADQDRLAGRLRGILGRT